MKLFHELMHLPEMQAEVKGKLMLTFEKLSEQLVMQVFTVIGESAESLPPDEREVFKRALARIQPAELTRRIVN